MQETVNNVDHLEKHREKYRRLGIQIATYRKLRGLTQEQFAEKLDKSLSFISQIEANNGSKVKGISLCTLFDISELLEIPESRFFDLL